MDGCGVMRVSMLSPMRAAPSTSWPSRPGRRATSAFLAEHGFLVGLTVDGPSAMHDVYRVETGGKPTFDRLRAG